jgi:hypothetical protein
VSESPRALHSLTLGASRWRHVVQDTETETSPLAKSYRGWFLDYASYVILDRAVPHIDDGLKPVQRRILSTRFWDMDDGRFHKVANIVGRSMSLHPHGDASIGAALVAIGQRAFLIEPQGNFGNILTGDEAAAPRYIEARLTNFAKDVLFNPKTTEWQLSYDGRAKEPVTLPAKFPLVLLEGAEGIAVGLATKILPHNFNDLCRAAINHLQGKTLPHLSGFSHGRHRRLLGVQRRRARRADEGPGQDRAALEVPARDHRAAVWLHDGDADRVDPRGQRQGQDQDQARRRQHGRLRVEILVHLPQGATPTR